MSPQQKADVKTGVVQSMITATKLITLTSFIFILGAGWNQNNADHNAIITDLQMEKVRSQSIDNARTGEMKELMLEVKKLNNNQIKILTILDTK